MDNKQRDGQPSDQPEGIDGASPQGIAGNDAFEAGFDESCDLLGNGDRSPLMGNGDR
jgi:hypothetical protein